MKNDELIHYGVIGMRWGIRRYQNPDGTLTKAGLKRYTDGRSYHNLNKRGKKLQKIVRDQAYANRDILADYDREYFRLNSTKTNKHAKRLIDDINEKYNGYKKIKDIYDANKTSKYKKKMELAYEKYEDALDTLKYANIRDNDRLYEKYIERLAEKTLTQLNSEVTESGKYFIKTLIGDYYKHKLDY